MSNRSTLQYLNRKKLVIKDLEYIIELKSKDKPENKDKIKFKWSQNNPQSIFSKGANPTDFLQTIENSNREFDEMEEHIGTILVAANNDRNILEECESYLQQKYKVYVNINPHAPFSSVHEYCLELLKNAKIRASAIASMPTLFVSEASPLKNHITVNPNKMNGQPCIRDLRLTVRRTLELLQTYPDRSELFKEFPDLTEEDIRQALIYADLHPQESIQDPTITTDI